MACTEPRHAADLPYVRHLLCAHVGCRAGDLALDIGNRGKPGIAAPPSTVSFSLSHSGGLTALAIAEVIHLGVDVEVERSVPDLLDIAALVLRDEEREFLSQAYGNDMDRRFLSLWVRKEASLKALGLGLGDDAREVLVATKNGWLSHVRHRRMPVLLCVTGFSFCGFQGAVASEMPLSVRLHHLEGDGPGEKHRHPVESSARS